MKKKKRIVATAYIDVPYGTPYTARDLSAELKNQAEDVIYSDIMDRCFMTENGLARGVGKLHVRAGFSLPRGHDKVATLDELIKRAEAECQLDPETVVHGSKRAGAMHHEAAERASHALQALKWLKAQRDG